MMNKKNVYKLFLFLFMLAFLYPYTLFCGWSSSPLRQRLSFFGEYLDPAGQAQFPKLCHGLERCRHVPVFHEQRGGYLVTTAVNLVFVTCAGYAFAKLTFPGKTFFYYMIIFNLLIPTAIILLPMFTMVNRMHLVNTLPALVFPYFQGFAPMGLIICRNYFEDLPDELMEAGKLDGCSNMQVFRKIMLPLAKPILATMAILSAMQVWNEYLWALTSITDESKYTLSVGVALFNKKTETVGYTPVFAALSISALVIVVVYLCMQKNFVKSIAAGAVKG